MKKIILASGSPRRAKILAEHGVEFTIAKSGAEEVSYPDDPERTVRENALAKGGPGNVLSADTIVWFNNRIYGKPRDLEEAREFLRELSGKVHTVFTGVAFNGDTRIVKSQVKFRELSEAMIDEYVARVHPTDRAGAYDIDESGDLIVESWSGSYENIMGLPLEPLKEWGIIQGVRTMNRAYSIISLVACAVAVSIAGLTEAATNEAPSAAVNFDAQTFVLKYAKATEVAESLNKLCKQLGVKEAAVAFPDSHTIAVAAPSNTLAACAKVIAEVDRKPQQVYVEARFFDVTVSDLESLGIHWGVLNDLTVSGSAGVNYEGTRDSDNNHSDRTVFTGTLSAENLSLMLAALRINADNRMIANPRVVVGSGKTATVDISTKRPNVIISAKRTVDGNNNSMDIDAKLQEVPGKDKLMFAGESFFWWGVSLLVEPYVAEDGIISARIVPNVSDLSDISQQTEGAYVTASSGSDDMPSSQFPIIDVKRIETEFSLKSGETAVIGGLSKTEWEELESGIPYLWKIPVIGPYIFGYTKRIRRQREIVIFVTMGLVDADKPERGAGLPKNAFISREYVNGKKKEPGDYTREELKEMYRQNEKPNSDND